MKNIVSDMTVINNNKAIFKTDISTFLLKLKKKLKKKQVSSRLFVTDVLYPFVVNDFATNNHTDFDFHCLLFHLLDISDLTINKELIADHISTLTSKSYKLSYCNVSATTLSFAHPNRCHFRLPQSN